MRTQGWLERSPRADVDWSVELISLASGRALDLGILRIRIRSFFTGSSVPEGAVGACFPVGGTAARVAGVENLSLDLLSPAVLWFGGARVV